MTTCFVRSGLELRVAIEAEQRGGTAPFPFCITPQAEEELLRTVGSRPPETGAKGFGPTDRMGIDTVEFDVMGSQRAGGAMYSPDTEWGEARVAFWLNQPDAAMKLWTSDLHSHPGGYGYPSGKSGPGLGDLGYVEEVFAQNEAMQHFLLPILTHTGTKSPVYIWPWVISRDAPNRPLFAPLNVCEAGEFPERIFNSAWESRITAQPPSPNTPLSLDFERLAWVVSARGKIVSDDQNDIRYELCWEGTTFVLSLPPGFPAAAPTLLAVDTRGRQIPIPFSWRDNSTDKPERRLARLCRRALKFQRRRF